MINQLVSNATPLIYLAKTDRLGLLKKLVQRTFIPEAVYQEVVVDGIKLGINDAHIVNNAVFEGWISIGHVKQIIHSDISIHSGEMEVISLAREMNIQIVLMDDIKARMACELAGLSPRGTIWLLLESVKRHVLGFDEFLTTFEQITRSGFYLKEEIYSMAVREAKKLANL